MSLGMGVARARVELDAISTEQAAVERALEAALQLMNVKDHLGGLVQDALNHSKNTTAHAESAGAALEGA